MELWDKLNFAFLAKVTFHAYYSDVKGSFVVAAAAVDIAHKIHMSLYKFTVSTVERENACSSLVYCWSHVCCVCSNWMRYTRNTMDICNRKFEVQPYIHRNVDIKRPQPDYHFQCVDYTLCCTRAYVHCRPWLYVMHGPIHRSRYNMYSMCVCVVCVRGTPFNVRDV